jgi:DHA1 family bicyclomycin/chloramphenicol resistance-like MFS transporter
MYCYNFTPSIINDTHLITLLGILTAFAPFSIDMYLAAFPSMAADMGTDVGDIQLTLSVFFLGMGSGQIFYGPLIDRFGRRVPLLAGLTLFTVSSFFLTFTTNFSLFVCLRFMQAVGGCAGMIIGRAIIRDRYSLQNAARALSLMIVVQSIGPVAAPVIGGYLLRISTWRMIFVTLCGLGLACFLATFFRLPETLLKENRVKNSPREILGVFLQLLSEGKFLAPALAGALGGATTFAFISGSPFVLMGLYEVNEVQYGWIFAAISIGMAGAGYVNQMLLRHIQVLHLLYAGLMCSIFFSAGILIILLKYGQPPLSLLFPPLFFTLATNPLAVANSTAVAMAAYAKHSGSASSLIGALLFACAGATSTLTGLMHNGTAYPMVVMMLVCSACALMILLLNRQVHASKGRV